MNHAPRAPRPRTRWNGHAVLERHFHGAPYAALVLDGAYEEAGDHGRISARPGYVLFHRSWSAHRNVFARAGAHVLNIPFAEEYAWPYARIADADAIVRVAERSRSSAARLLLASITPLPRQLMDWPDQLASALTADPELGVGDWARSMGLRPETVSRGFHQAFGVTAARFRRDIRTLQAIRQVSADHGRALADIAAETGFADQAHMSRAVKCVTGLSPAHLRRLSNPFKAQAGNSA